jgi:predicted nucleic acid-binding protein
VVPTHQDWLDTGEFLASKIPAGGHVSKELLAYIRKMQNDALIAFSCWSRGYTVVTSNGADFEELQVFWKAPRSRLVIEPAPT